MGWFVCMCDSPVHASQLLGITDEPPVSACVSSEIGKTHYDGPSVPSSPARTPIQTVLHIFGGKQEEQGSSLRKNQSQLTIRRHMYIFLTIS